VDDGVDAVIVAAALLHSDEPMHQAAQMCRKRGRIVLVGVTGLKLIKRGFLQKGTYISGLCFLWTGSL
jgi:threonine dehydrogenase-like Zn-dependent dehydrogenase